MSFSTPSTVAARHSCLRPNASVITSAQVIPSAYSLIVPSGKVTLIIDITLASDCRNTPRRLCLTILGGRLQPIKSTFERQYLSSNN